MTVILNIIFIIITLLVVIYFFLYRCESFENDKTKLNHLIHIISSIPNFDKKKAIELTSPSSIINTNIPIWGIFTNLDEDIAINQLFFKKDMLYDNAYFDHFPLKNKNKNNYLLNKKQIESLVDFVEKRDLITKIILKYNQIKPLIELCLNDINIYIKNTEKIDINFNTITKNTLEKLSINKLSILHKIIFNIPVNVCDSVKIINKIENIKKTNYQKFNNCIKSLDSFIEYQFKIKNLPKNIFLDSNLNDLEFIYKIYNYLDKSNYKCNQLNLDKDFIIKTKNKYKNKLLADLNVLIENSKKKKCISEIKDYVNEKSDQNKIPKYYLGENLNNYSEENLEMLTEIYSNIPECNYFIKDNLINKCIIMDKYFRIQGGHAFGCHNHINKFRENIFKQNKIKLPIPIKKNDYEKYNLRELNEILEIYKNTPPCYLLYNDNMYTFDNKINKYINIINDLKKDSNKSINNMVDLSNDILDSRNHPYNKTLTRDIKYQKNNNNKEEILDLEHKNYNEAKDDFNQNMILNNSISNQPGDSLFKDDANKIINPKKLENKLKSIENKLKRCCNQNDNISQSRIKGSASTFSPEIIIETDKNNFKMI